ncbi:MAG TPA: DUF2341 domain-containing protein [Chitinispirillaceae bacterium]|nr:DUF2341 domain-containing protein [Chitinispirillaceae bacterium]
MKYLLCSILCFITLLLTILSCGTTSVAGGSSSTDNGKVFGHVLRENGDVAPNTVVKLYKSDFDPYRDSITIIVDTTNELGEYAFSKLSSGAYTVEAVDIRYRTRALVQSIIVDSLNVNATIAMLSQTGTITIMIPDDTSDTNSYVYIPGTSYFSKVLNRIAVIDSVPAGIITKLLYKNNVDMRDNHTVTTDVKVISGTGVIVTDYYGWSYSKQLVLNTSKTGAGIQGTVTNFPVLVRLSENNFDFSQARNDGRDIRFKKSNDIPLIYEIERWDAAAKKAELWVMLDTLKGNDSEQYITMLWGNADVPGDDIVNSVFDTSEGFQGVWHMNGKSGDAVNDATSNQYHGTPSGTSLPGSVEGVIGTARSFDGLTSYVVMQNSASGKLDMQQNGDYTFSLWVNADSIDSLWHVIASKGHEQYYLKYKCFGNQKATWEFVEFQDQKGWDICEDSIPSSPGPGQWVHLTGVRNGSKQFLYINGNSVDSTISSQSGNYKRITTDDFFVGRSARQVLIPGDEGWCYFKGKIDEIRLVNRVLSPDWIRLAYMNQKTDDALVQFR